MDLVSHKSKIMKRILGLFLMVIFLGSSGNAQESKKERKARQQLEMAQLIHSGKFRFVARSAQSELGNFDNLGANYDMVFDSLHIKAFLPYYGRAYSVPYGGSEGVKFDLTAQKMEKNWNEKKKLFSLSAELSDSNDSYSIFLTTGLNGYADIKITFTNRSWIDYYGTIEKTHKTKTETK